MTCLLPLSYVRFIPLNAGESGGDISMVLVDDMSMHCCMMVRVVEIYHELLLFVAGIVVGGGRICIKQVSRKKDKGSIILSAKPAHFWSYRCLFLAQTCS